MWRRVYKRTSQRRLPVEHLPSGVFPETDSAQQWAPLPDLVYYTVVSINTYRE